MAPAWKWLIAICLAGCGRIGFDERATGDATDEDPAPRFSGLIARYSMETDPASGVLPDVSGHGHDATCAANGCATSIEGRFGKAFQFDGVAQIYEAPDDPELHTPAAFTIAAWVFLDTDVDIRVAAGKPFGSALENSYNLFSTVGSGACGEYSTSSDANAFCSMTPFPVGTWVHEMEIWDGSVVALYVGGVAVASVSLPENIAFDNHPVVIGADLDTGLPAVFWPGRIDEVQIYNRALTTAEIAQLSR